MPDMAIGVCLGLITGVACMTWGWNRLLGKYRDALMRVNVLQGELRVIETQTQRGTDWQALMPFACDDAKMVGIFSDRVPTELDRIDAMCQIVWVNTETSQVWKSTEPGVWLAAGHGHRSPDSFVAITPDDDFMFIHGGNYPGFRALLDHIVSERDGTMEIGDPRAIPIDPLPFILMDAGTTERDGTPALNWSLIRGLHVERVDALPKKPFASTDRPAAPGRRPIILDDPA